MRTATAQLADKKSVLSSSVLIISCLTLIGLALRLWEINFGLPVVPFSNEEITTFMTVNLASGDFNPHHFYHPHFYYYICFFFDALFILFNLATGHFHHLSDAWILFKKDPTLFYTVGRSVSAVLGTLTIPLTYLMGKKVFNERAGILGALFLTFSLLHVQWSQIAYMDVPLAFFVMVSFLFGFRALENGKLLDFILCGLFGGFSMSTKYQGVVTLIWGPLACYLYALKHHKNPFSALRNVNLLVYFASFFTGFTLGTPFWLLGFPEFFHQHKQLGIWIKPYGQGHAGMEGNWNWFYYLSPTTSYSTGLLVLGMSILGVIYLALHLDKRRFFFLSFPVLYFLIIGAAKLRQVKYIMPIVPFLCVAAGFVIVWFVDEMMVRKKGQKSKIIFALGLLTVFPSLVACLRYDYLKIFPDTRNLVNAWAMTHIPPGSKVLVTSAAFLHSPSENGFTTADLDATVMDQRLDNRSSLKSLDEYRTEGFNYVILDEWHLSLLLIEEADNPKYRDVLQRYSKFLDDLKKSGQRMIEFSPYRGKKPMYDRENVFLASRSLWKLKSLGPVIQIYKL